MNPQLGHLTIFNIYQGSLFAINKKYEKKYNKRGVMLLNLLDKLPKHIKDFPSRLYFDKYFTSLQLVNHLSSLNYGGTGTIRDNKISQCCPLKPLNKLKKQARVKVDTVYDT